MITNFDAAKRLLSLGDSQIQNQYKDFSRKNDLFFIDHELIPLLV